MGKGQEEIGLSNGQAGGGVVGGGGWWMEGSCVHHGTSNARYFGGESCIYFCTE